MTLHAVQGQAMECLFSIFEKSWPCYDASSLYQASRWSLRIIFRITTICTLNSNKPLSGYASGQTMCHFRRLDRSRKYLQLIIKSSRYTGGHFMFCTDSYATAAARVAAALCRLLFTRLLLNNFLDFFHFGHDCWPWPIDYLIRFWLIFVVTLTLNFQGQIWNFIYLSQKWSDCHKTKSKHIDWTTGLKCDIGFDLGLECSRLNIEFAISQPKIVRFSRNEKQPYWLNSRPQMWPPGLILVMTSALNFQGQIWNLLYLSQKWSDCQETKSKHVDWTVGLERDQWI